MSGDAGGVILGALALVALPYALAGAAAVAVGYGAVKAGGVIARKVREDHRIKQIEIDNCSRELSNMYGSINAAINNANLIQERYDEEMKVRFEEINRDIQRMSLTNDAEIRAFDRALRQRKANIEEIVSMSTNKTKQRIVSDIRQAVTKSSQEFENAKRANGAIADWKQALAAGKSAQQNVAKTSIQDAKATIRLLERLKASCTNPDFCNEVDALISSMRTAENNYDNGLYEAAVANANTIVTQGAITASEMTLDEYERNQAMYELETRLELHKSELEGKRFFTVPFMNENIEVDLNDFSQGLYERALNDIENKLANLHNNVQNMSARDMKNEIKNCDIIKTEGNEEIPIANIIHIAQKEVQSYYERLGILDLVAEHMVSQGYTPEWVRSVGDDMTQKLVIHFSNPTLGNEVSVSIDTENVEELCRCALELSCFYDNNRPFTEQQKQALRDSINNYLHENGYEGGFACSGNQNRASGRVELQTENNVINTTPISIY